MELEVASPFPRLGDIPARKYGDGMALLLSRLSLSSTTLNPDVLVLRLFDGSKPKTFVSTFQFIMQSLSVLLIPGKRFKCPIEFSYYGRVAAVFKTTFTMCLKRSCSGSRLVYSQQAVENCKC